MPVLSQTFSIGLDAVKMQVWAQDRASGFRLERWVQTHLFLLLKNFCGKVQAIQSRTKILTFINHKISFVLYVLQNWNHFFHLHFEILKAFPLFQQSLSDVTRSSSGPQSKRSSLDSNCLDSSRDTDNETPFNSPMSANKPSKPDIPPSGETERSAFQNFPFSLQFIWG